MRLSPICWRIMLIVSMFSVKQLTAEADEDDDGAVPIDQSKLIFVPTEFKEPKLSDSSSVYLWEYFNGPSVLDKTWLKSKAKKDGVESELSKYNGEWAVETPSTVTIKNDFALIVKTDARHHAIAARLNKPYAFHPDQDKPLVLQYEVRFEEGQSCGGGYVKLLSKGAEKELDNFNDKTEYTIMFGPDKCSPSGKIHLIFRFRNPKNKTVSEYHARQASSVPINLWDDHKPHLYTLVVRPDGHYTVTVDKKSLMDGYIEKDLTPALEPPAQIADPEDKKPADWDEVEQIDDVTATKPEDWDENAPRQIVDETAVKPSDWLDDEEMTIPDAAAVKPADWDNDMDGEWEPPRVDNPNCAPSAVSGCGEWKAPLKDNPNYKGKWVRPKIANPNYRGKWAARVIDNPHYFKPERPLGYLDDISAVGIELWTMSKNIVFDNILIAESEAVAEEAALLTYDFTKSEMKRQAAESGDDHGVFQPIFDYAEDRPWMWAVYVLAVIVPIILITIACFGRKSGAQPSSKVTTDVGYRKKRDITLDDEDDVEEEEEEEAPILVDKDGHESSPVEATNDSAQPAPVEQESQAKPQRRSSSRSKSGSRSPARPQAAKKQVTPGKGGARAAVEALNASEESGSSEVEENEKVLHVQDEEEQDERVEQKSPAGSNLKKRRAKKAD